MIASKISTLTFLKIRTCSDAIQGDGWSPLIFRLTATFSPYIQILNTEFVVNCGCPASFGMLNDDVVNVEIAGST